MGRPSLLDHLMKDTEMAFVAWMLFVMQAVMGQPQRVLRLGLAGDTMLGR